MTALITWDTNVFGGGSNGHINQKKEQYPIPALDNDFYFDDAINVETGVRNHDYYRKDEHGWRLFKGSCTGIIEQYKQKFDGVATYNQMVAGGRTRNPDDEYYGMTLEQVLAQWKEGGEEASHLGSLMHLEIEKFFNNCANWTSDEGWVNDEDNLSALIRFLKFFLDIVVPQGIVPFRTELNIWEDDTEFAGQCDLLYRRKEWLIDPTKANWVGIADWKKSKKDVRSNFSYRKNMLGVCSSLPNCSRSFFTLQMTLYAVVLQRRTNFVVKEMHLGVFHPNNESYVWEPIQPVWSIAEAMLSERRATLLAKYKNDVNTLLHESNLHDSDLGKATRALLGLVSSQK
jgi:hypothetical protein